MAHDLVTVMARLGYERFSVAGHDRGGRVAYRLALDHPSRIDRLAVLDVLPTGRFGTARMRALPWPSGPGRCWPSRSRCPSASWRRHQRPSWTMRWAAGARHRPCFLPRSARPMSRPCAIPPTSTPSARNTAPPRPSTARTTPRIVPAEGGSPARSWPCGAVAVPSMPGTRRRAGRWRSGASGPTTFVAMPSTPAISSRRRCPSRPPRPWHLLRRLTDCARTALRRRPGCATIASPRA